MPVQYSPLPTRGLRLVDTRIASGFYFSLRIAPGELFRSELRGRLHRQTLQPTLPHCSFRDTTHDAWRTCERCGKKARGMKKCSGCRLAYYCDVSCQKSHWNARKECCSPDAALPIGRHYITYISYGRDTFGHDPVN
jgi:hypothetical protein